MELALAMMQSRSPVAEGRWFEVVRGNDDDTDHEEGCEGMQQRACEGMQQRVSDAAHAPSAFRSAHDTCIHTRTSAPSQGTIHSAVVVATDAQVPTS